jgi:hypothetical protein
MLILCSGCYQTLPKKTTISQNRESNSLLVSQIPVKTPPPINKKSIYSIESYPTPPTPPSYIKKGAEFLAEKVKNETPINNDEQSFWPSEPNPTSSFKIKKTPFVVYYTASIVACGIFFFIAGRFWKKK